MVQSFEITDEQNLPVNYAEDIFHNGDYFEFKPGTNIIVGENGCGKTTLLRMMKKYLLCDNSIDSMNIRDIRDLFHTFNDKMCNGAKLKADYSVTAFNLRSLTDMDEDEKLNNLNNFRLTYSSMHASTGENILLAVENLCKRMFDKNGEFSFPIENIKREIGSLNACKKVDNRYQQYLEYIEANRIEMKVPYYTIFMDEPDRNLSLNNLKQIYSILSAKKENTQIIAVIHNPLLIHRLSKDKDINMIELSRGYLKKVDRFIKEFSK